jgi:predicted dithiol-disulfide oxidoreductase (DUF899 family)
MKLRPAVSAAEWWLAHDKLLVKEKEATRARDALAAERRRQPIIQIDKDYVFEAPGGEESLLDLFEGRRQLIVYHFMFAPGVDGWPSAGCTGCSMFVDNVGELAHLHARDTSFALVSRAPLANIQPYKQRMGWNHAVGLFGRHRLQRRLWRHGRRTRNVRPQRFRSRRRQHLPQLLHGGTWCRDTRHRLDVP